MAKPTLRPAWAWCLEVPGPAGLEAKRRIGPAGLEAKRPIIRNDCSLDAEDLGPITIKVCHDDDDGDGIVVIIFYKEYTGGVYGVRPLFKHAFSVSR